MPSRIDPLTLRIVVVAALPEASQGKITEYARTMSTGNPEQRQPKSQLVDEAAVACLVFAPMPSTPYLPLKGRPRKADDTPEDDSGSCLGSIVRTFLLGILAIFVLGWLVSFLAGK